MATYQLRILKSTWGIAIDLTAEALLGGSPPGDAIAISDGLHMWLGSPPMVLPPDEVELLVSGLRRVAPMIEVATRGKQPVTVKICQMTFGPADFQPEGLEPAIIGWAAEELGFEAPEPEVTFDREANRYLIAYASPPDP